MTARQSIVIVGGGLAGLRAAERLRELGYAGSLTMVGEERHAPYNRPPLSKQVLEHKLHPDDLGFTTYVDLDVEARSGVRATRLEPHTRQVVLDTGEALDYDGLVIATGVSARRLPNGPNDDERVLTLRTVDDAVISFERNYEQAGTPNYEDRKKWGKIALAAFGKQA